MNINDKRHQHCKRHVSSEFLREANAIADGKLFTSALIKKTRDLYMNRGGAPYAIATGVQELGDGQFNLGKSVEVVPLGSYTNQVEMVNDLCLWYRADIVCEIDCDGRQIVDARRHFTEDLTEGLSHVVTVVCCDGTYYPMLVIAMRNGK